MRGITGKVLRIIKNIYNSSKVQVDGPAQSYTSDIERGVRQGCLMSPVLFEIFIERSVDWYGAVRSESAWSSPTVTFRMEVPGLMFANDILK